MLIFNVRTCRTVWEAKAGKFIAFTFDTMPVPGNRNLEDYVPLLCGLYTLCAQVIGNCKLGKQQRFRKIFIIYLLMKNWCLRNTGYKGDRCSEFACLEFLISVLIEYMNTTKHSDNFVPGSNTNCFWCILLYIIIEHDQDLLIGSKYFTVGCVNHRITRKEIVLHFSVLYFPDA